VVDRREFLAVCAGGFLGAIARAALSEALPSAPDTWPWPTFLVNLAGAFLLAYTVVRLQERLPLSAYRRPFLGTGFCGALTTFSAMQIELIRMLDAHDYVLAATYTIVSVALGLGCIGVATNLVRRTRIA
jgi:CrcB protein